MLRFIPRSTPAKLVNFLFQIIIRKDQTKQIVSAIQRFPEGDPDIPVAKKVEIFVYPDPSSIERGTFLTFVIRDGEACQIGFALYYSISMAFCILSDFYYPRIFGAILRSPEPEMMTFAKSLNSVEIRETVTIRRLTWPLDGSRERQKLMKLIFSTFPPYDISKIVIGLIQNRHLFVVATSAQTCSTFAAAMSLLIEPFRWDNAIIPLLPLQILDMVQSPMPVLVGLTRPESLDPDMVSAHICVNCDIKLVIDSPVFEAGSPTRLKILAEQMNFAQLMTAQLHAWKKCRGFPHEVISAQVQRFISQYLMIYTGPCPSSERFIRKVKHLPEHVLGSQVFAELTRVEELDPVRRQAFTRWFGQVFAQDMGVIMKTTATLDAEGMDVTATSRAANELKQLAQQPVPGASLATVGGDLLKLEGTIIGPASTPYADGIFKIRFSIPPTYPFDEPLVIMTTPIYHPAVGAEGDDKGRVCMEGLLGKKWAAALSIRHILEGFRELLRDPKRSTSPPRPELAAEIASDPEGFETKAREFTLAHAH